MAIIKGYDAWSDWLAGTSSGDTLYGYGQNDWLYGYDGNDILNGGAGSDFLDGGNGSDTADYTNAARGVYASLTPGVYNLTYYSNNDAYGDVYVSIENLTGSVWYDYLRGDGGNNVIRGGGNYIDLTTPGRYGDSLYGEGGHDTLYGGWDRDYISGGDGNDILYVSDPKFGNIDYGYNYLDGGNDDDTLNAARSSNNIFVGGSGVDTVSYAAAQEAITADLLNQITWRGQVNTGTAYGDTYGGIENLTGTSYDDTLAGNAESNVLNGGYGNDTLIGRGGGDTFIGGPGATTTKGWTILDLGEDTVSYYETTASYGVSAYLDQPWFNSGDDAVGDSYLRIDNLEGTAFSDILGGDSFDNKLTGREGDDELIGGWGNDVLYGNEGDDYLYGGSLSIWSSYGSDSDTLIGGPGADRIDGSGGVDTASYVNSASGVSADLQNRHNRNGDAQGDTLFNVENLTGSDFDDDLFGNAGFNTLDGGLGGDRLDGDAGNDRLIGDFGRDSLTGGTGGDTFVFRSVDESNWSWSYNVDRINDYNKSEGDVIDLSAIDANPALLGDQAFTVASYGYWGFNPTASAGQLWEAGWWDGTEYVGYLFGEVNGDHSADLVIQIISTQTPWYDHSLIL